MTKATSVEKRMRAAATAVSRPKGIDPGRPIKVGVDLGTAFTVMMVTDDGDKPLAGAMQFADVVRDHTEFFAAREGMEVEL